MKKVMAAGAVFMVAAGFSAAQAGDDGLVLRFSGMTRDNVPMHLFMGNEEMRLEGYDWRLEFDRPDGRVTYQGIGWRNPIEPELAKPSKSKDANPASLDQYKCDKPGMPRLDTLHNRLTGQFNMQYRGMGVFKDSKASYKLYAEDGGAWALVGYMRGDGKTPSRACIANYGSAFSERGLTAP